MLLMREDPEVTTTEVTDLFFDEDLKLKAHLDLSLKALPHLLTLSSKIWTHPQSPLSPYTELGPSPKFG